MEVASDDGLCLNGQGMDDGSPERKPCAARG